MSCHKKNPFVIRDRWACAEIDDFTLERFFREIQISRLVEADYKNRIERLERSMFCLVEVDESMDLIDQDDLSVFDADTIYK